MNHFDPTYFANKSWNLADIEGSEQFYKIARVYYEKSHKKIIDCTVGGNLKVFAKGNLHDLENANSKDTMSMFNSCIQLNRPKPRGISVGTTSIYVI